MLGSPYHINTTYTSLTWLFMATSVTDWGVFWVPTVKCLPSISLHGSREGLTLWIKTTESHPLALQEDYTTQWGSVSTSYLKYLNGRLFYSLPFLYFVPLEIKMKQQKWIKRGLQFIGWNPNYFSPVKDLFQVTQEGTELHFSSALGREYQFSKATKRTGAWARPNPAQKTWASTTMRRAEF